MKRVACRSRVSFRPGNVSDDKIGGDRYTVLTDPQAEMGPR